MRQHQVVAGSEIQPHRGLRANRSPAFVVRKRAARTGRNPRTGATIKIKASKVPAFKAGKALKDALN